MKKKILLIDESLTVQKVVALTLDKTKYQLSFAKSRPEIMKRVLENAPDLILVSDQMSELNIASFPKELESWLGALREAAPVILISNQDVKEQKHYAGVLKKPFSPQSLQSLVQELLRDRPTLVAPGEGARSSANTIEDSLEYSAEAETDSQEEQRLQKIFNDTFADESVLVRETFRAEVDAEEPTLLNFVKPRAVETVAGQGGSGLWEVGNPKLNALEGTAAAGADLPNPPVNDLWNSGGAAPAASSPVVISDAAIRSYLSSQNLDELVDKCLSKLVPPIVEKMVNERLDKLLKDQEKFLDLKA